MLIPRRSIRTSQPQHSIAIDWSKPITRGLKVVILPSLGWQAKDLARGLGYSAFSGGVERAPVVIGSPGKAFRSNGYLYNQYISIPSWVNVTNEGSALIIRSGAGGRLWELGDSGNSDEFPYSGLVYTDAFWLGRWANGVAPPSGKQFDVPLTLAVSVKDGRQVAFWDAEKWWSNNQSGGFTLPSSLQFGASAGGPSGGTHDTYLALAWDRALSDAELKSVSENPWQIFEDEEDYVFIPAAGGGGGVDLVVQRSVHGHAADALSFSMDVYLSTADSLHTHAADNIALSLDSHLTISDANHAHVADDITLDTTASTSLLVQDAHHAHVADGVILTTQWLLAVASALHAHAAENLSLGTTGATNLLIDDASSAHASDNVGLSLDSFLAILDGLHGHGADNIALGTTGEATLTIAEAIHAHTADSIGLTIAALLVIAEALHAHYGGAVVLSLPGEMTLTADDIAAVAAAVIAALNATTGSRTIGQHLQIQTAVLAGNETGAGTSHITFADGAVTVEADVPLPGEVGDRANVVVSGV